MNSLNHMQYGPGDQGLADQIVYELKSKGIFDQFRKECIADVDTRPAYQNLRQRVEGSVSTFLSRQTWRPDLNKNQLREKLRKHIFDGHYLEQGVERIVDQVVNPKVASVFIPQVEDLVYNYFGVNRRKSVTVNENSDTQTQVENNSTLLPTDLEAVSPGSVKSNHDEKNDMDVSENEMPPGVDEKMDIDGEDSEPKLDDDDTSPPFEPVNNLDKIELPQETQLSGISELTLHDDTSIDKSAIPLPSEEIKLENIPAPREIELESIELPEETNSINIPLPDEMPTEDKEIIHDQEFKPSASDDDSSSDSSLRRNMSPITPIRNFDNENSCDAQQGFDNFNSPESKSQDKKNPFVPISTFRFSIENKDTNSNDKSEKKPIEQTRSYQLSLTTYSTPLLQTYEDSSNSNNLQIDYESDANSKINSCTKIPETDQNSESLPEAKPKDSKSDDRRSSKKSSHSSRDRHRGSSKDKRSESKHSSSRDRKDSKYDKKPSSKDDSSKSKSNHKESSKEVDKRDSRESSKSRHSSTHKSSKDSKSHRSSSHRHSSSSSKNADDRKSSSHRDKTDRRSDSKGSKEHRSSSRDSSRHNSSHRSDKDRKSSVSSKSKHSDEKDKDKKDKKPVDDHYSLSGRGNNGRRSTDRDSNDGNSSSSKGSNIQPSSKSLGNTKENKSSSKSGNTSSSSETTSQSDCVDNLNNNTLTNIEASQLKPIVRVENNLKSAVKEVPPFQLDSFLKKSEIDENIEEEQLLEMRRIKEEENIKMQQEAALLLEFRQNVRPSLSQVYSVIPGPELEFACMSSFPEQVINPNHSASYAESSNVIRDNEFVMENINNEAIEENIVNNLNDQQQIVQKNVEDPQQFSDIESTMEAIHGESEHVTNAKAEEEAAELHKLGTDESKNLTAHYEVTVIAEELTEDDEIVQEVFARDGTNCNEQDVAIGESNENLATKTDINAIKLTNIEECKMNSELNITANDSEEIATCDILQIKEERGQNELDNNCKVPMKEDDKNYSAEKAFKYFSETEKYEAELEKDKFTKFHNSYTKKTLNTEKLYLINCDLDKVEIIENASREFGNFEVINYYRNGCLKITKNPKNCVKNIKVNEMKEISIPLQDIAEVVGSSNFSAIKRKFTLESSEYAAKIKAMAKTTSRQEIMEIILGDVITDGSPSKMPKIDIYKEDEVIGINLKRKLNICDNNNTDILSPNKIRKDSEQTASIVEEINISPHKLNNTQKYISKIKRLGQNKPTNVVLPNSPSNEKSVENYERNTETGVSTHINGKLKVSPRNNFQRYDRSDLYKPKLHYLSRRNVLND